MTQEELDALMAGDFEDEGEVKEDVSADIPVDTPSIEDEMIDRSEEHTSELQSQR